MSWLTSVRNALSYVVPKKETPDNLWHKCKGCGQMVFAKELEDNLYVCPHCDHHDRIGPDDALRTDCSTTAATRSCRCPRCPRIRSSSATPKRYADRIKAARAATGESDALINARGTIDGRKAVVGVQDFAFMGGSMGLAVGEAFVRGVEAAIARQRALYHLHRGRRRADAGGHPVADADAARDGRDRRCSTMPGCPISSC